jgi:drug/metabolite transporter (DMT)-like permease
MMTLWVILALAAVLAFGGAFAALRPLNASDSHVSPFLVMGIDSALNIVVCVVGFLIAARHHYREEAEALTPRNLGWICAYGVGILIGNMCLLFAARQPNVKVSVLTVLTSAYPIITILLCFNEWKELKLQFVIPGAVLTLSGVVLLCLS